MPDYSEILSQREADLRVIEAMSRAGSDLTKAHDIEHHFICYSRKLAKQLHSWGIDQGLQTTDIIAARHEGKRYYWLDFVIPTMPSIENIFADTSRFFRLADSMGASYDGWQCSIVR